VVELMVSAGVAAISNDSQHTTTAREPTRDP